MKSHNRFSGTLAEAAAEPARTLSSWQGEGALGAIPQPTCCAGELAEPGGGVRAGGEGKAFAIF